jgi:predicted Zn-dependent protease
LAAIFCVVLLAVGGTKTFEKWRHHRLLSGAALAFATGDYNAAEAFATRVLQANPDDIAARRVLANCADKQGRPYAVSRWRRVTLVRSSSPEDALNWARAALQFDQPEIADKALQRISSVAGNLARYHELRGQLAMSRKNAVGAVSYYAKAAEIDPKNPLIQIELASAALQTGDPAQQQFGRDILKPLQEKPEAQREATRLLLEHARAMEDWPRAVQLGERLQSYPGSTFSDRLAYLDALRHGQEKQFEAYLPQLQASAQDDQQVAQLLAWMNRNNLSEQALEWSRTISAAVVSQPIVAVAIADTYVARGEWKPLRQLVATANWRNREYLRQLFLARSLRELGDDLGYRDAWAKALRAAESNPNTLLRLTRTLIGWGWGREAEEVYMRLAARSETHDLALQTLYKHYADIGDTRSLYTILLRLARDKPDDITIQNNVALLSLLLNVDPNRAHKLARELYAKAPNNPACASTYAYSLYLNKAVSKALSVMNSLSEEQRREPAVAAYYGIILAASGAPASAKHYLQLGRQASLLPEEKELVAKAGESIGLH